MNIKTNLKKDQQNQTQNGMENEIYTTPYFLYKDDVNSGLGFSNIVAALLRNSKYIIILAIVGAVLGYIFSEIRGPVYVSSAVVVFEPENSTHNLLEISEGLSTNRSAVETQLDVFKSTELLGNVIERIIDKHKSTGIGTINPARTIPELPREEQIKWLSSATVVGRKGESLALTIVVRVPDSTLAADLANEIARTYIDRRINQKRNEILIAENILKQRTSEIISQLSDSEEELAVLVQSKQLNDLELDTRLRARVLQLKAQMDNIIPETTEDQQKLIILKNETEVIQKKLIDRTIATIRKEEILREIESSRQRHEQIFEQLLRVEAENIIMSPGAQLVSTANAPLEPTGLSSKTASVLGLLSVSFISILATIFMAAFDRRLRTTAQLESILNAPCLGTIPLHSETDETLISYFTRPIRKASLNGDGCFPKWHDVVSDPTESSRVNEDETLEEEGFFKQMKKGSRSIFSTSVRKTFFNLHTQLPKNKNAIIGVTSCSQNEGKSTISTCLAAAASSKEQRIAIVDFDMWHHGVDILKEADDESNKLLPQHLKDGDPNDQMPSLEDWFTKDKSLDEIRIKASGFNNVDVFPWIIKDEDHFVDPDESKIKTLFNYLRSEYDLTIVDTAPFLLVSETAVISTELDGFIVVVAWEQITDHALQELKNAMDLARNNIIGSVLNRVDPRKQKLYGLGEYAQYYRGEDGYH